MADESAEGVLAALQERLGYRFDDPALLEQALTHPTFARDQQLGATAHNQRLEFLGDSVLQTVLSEALFERYPEQREGLLSRWRSMLCKGETLVRLADELRLEPALRIGETERQTRGRARRLEDALEALIGALYLDAGWERARAVVLRLYGDLQQRLEATEARHNAKGRLQEYVQGLSPAPELSYHRLDATGPDHRRHYTVEVRIDDTPFGTGSGTSIKAAENAAANQAIERLDLQAP